MRKEEATSTTVPMPLHKTEIIQCPKKYTSRLLVGIPTTGIVRYEWAAARFGQVIPVNWSCGEMSVAFADTVSPIGYNVHDARNVIIEAALQNGVEWLFFLDHDVLIPPDCFIKLGKYVADATVPVVSGLYYCKGNPCEPLLFRGRGNGAFTDWKLGDKVWVDGIPMGCALIHMSIFEKLAEKAETYKLADNREVRKFFWTPRDRWWDPETFIAQTNIGTEDLWWCDRVLEQGILAEGWPAIEDQKNPFLCDTGLFCKHIDTNTGVKYPN